MCFSTDHFLAFFFKDPATTAIYTLSLHDALPISGGQLVQATDQYVGTLRSRIVLVDDAEVRAVMTASWLRQMGYAEVRSEEHTSELQSHSDLVCRLLLEKKNRGQCVHGPFLSHDG